MSDSDADIGDHPDVEFPTDASEASPLRYLFAVDGDHPRQLLPLVCDLVAEADGELVIGFPVVLPEPTSIEAPEPRLEAERLVSKLTLEAKERYDLSATIGQVVIPGRDRGSIIQSMVEEYDISTLITEDTPHAGISALLGFDSVSETAVTEGCNTIIASRIELLPTLESILVPIAQGPHSGLAIDTGLTLARQHDATLELLHVTTNDEDDSVTGQEVLDSGIDRVAGYPDAEHTLLDAPDIPTAIIEYAEPFDLTILGAPREGLLHQFILGTVPDDVSTDTDGTVLITHHGNSQDSWLSQLV